MEQYYAYCQRYAAFNPLDHVTSLQNILYPLPHNCTIMLQRARQYYFTKHMYNIVSSAALLNVKLDYVLRMRDAGMIFDYTHLIDGRRFWIERAHKHAINDLIMPWILQCNETRHAYLQDMHAVSPQDYRIMSPEDMQYAYWNYINSIHRIPLDCEGLVYDFRQYMRLKLVTSDNALRLPRLLLRLVNPLYKYSEVNIRNAELRKICWSDQKTINGYLLNYNLNLSVLHAIFYIVDICRVVQGMPCTFIRDHSMWDFQQKIKDYGQDTPYVMSCPHKFKMRDTTVPPGFERQHFEREVYDQA